MMKLSAASPQYSLQPGDVGLKSTRGDDDRTARDPLSALEHDPADPLAVAVQRDDARVVTDAYAEARRGVVVRVHELLAAAEEEQVRARQVQRARQRLLPENALLLHPCRERHRLAQRELRERAVRLAARDAQEIVEELVDRICARRGRQRTVVREPDIARVASVAAAHTQRRALEEQDVRAGTARGDRCGERGIPAAHDDDVGIHRRALRRGGHEIVARGEEGGAS